MYIKRALYSLKHSWAKNLALVLLYAAIFGVTLGILVSFFAVNRELDAMQSTLGSSVTLHAPTYMGSTENGSISRIMSIPEEDREKFVDSPFVRGYNLVGDSGTVDMEGIEPVVHEYARDFYEYQLENEPGNIGADGTLVPMLNSEFYEAFTVYGYRLVQGRNFTEADTDGVLISRALAELNGLEVGDELTFSTANYVKTHLLKDEGKIQFATLHICGIFDPPDRDENEYRDSFVWDSAEQIVFASEAASSKVLYNRSDSYPRITAYLYDPADTESFIQEVKSKLDITDVVGSISGFGYEWSDLSLSDFQESFAKTPHYTLIRDQEFYDYVAKPMENTRNIMGGFLLALLIGGLAILLLLMAIFVRGREREFGILLAMGEHKWKMSAQIFLEILLPMVLAAGIGFVLSQAVATPLIEEYSASLLDSQVDETQADRQALLSAAESLNMGDEKLPADVLWDRSPGKAVANQELDFTVAPQVYGLYFFICFGGILLALILQLLFMMRTNPARMMVKRD